MTTFIEIQQVFPAPARGFVIELVEGKNRWSNVKHPIVAVAVLLERHVRSPLLPAFLQVEYSPPADRILKHRSTHVNGTIQRLCPMIVHDLHNEGIPKLILAEKLPRKTWAECWCPWPVREDKRRLRETVEMLLAMNHR